MDRRWATGIPLRVSCEMMGQSKCGYRRNISKRDAAEAYYWASKDAAALHGVLIIGIQLTTQALCPAHTSQAMIAMFQRHFSVVPVCVFSNILCVL